MIHREKSVIRWVGVILDEYVMVQTYAIKGTNAVYIIIILVFQSPIICGLLSHTHTATTA